MRSFTGLEVAGDEGKVGEVPALLSKGPVVSDNWTVEGKHTE